MKQTIIAVRRVVLAAALAGAAALPALAQQNPANFNNGPTHSYSVTIGTTAVQIMPAVATRYHFYLNNPSAATAIWCSWLTTTPTANGAGSFLLPPAGATPVIGNANDGFADENALYCIAAAATTPLTADAFPQ